MSTALATENDNFFSSYARAANRRTIVGDILKFSKGDWAAGQNDEEIDEGSQFVAMMDELMIGWVRWDGGRPVEHRMGKLVEGFHPAKRAELGDMDEAEWEYDGGGKKRDPWQLTNYLILKDRDTDRLFTFAPSSRGGLSAIGQLCEAYGKAIRAKPDQFPVVEIGTSSYKHDSYGKIKVPTLTVVGWAPKAAAMAALDAGTAHADDDPDGDIPF